MDLSFAWIGREFNGTLCKYVNTVESRYNDIFGRQEMSIHLDFSKNSPKYLYNEIVEKINHKFLHVKLVYL